MKFNPSPSQPAVALQWKLTTLRFDEWLHSEVFTWQWWALLAIMAATALLMWKLSDKKRLVETALYTAIIILFIIVLDEIGEEMLLWYYPIDVLFMFPPTSAVDVSSMPLVYMLIFQLFKSWKSFTIATFVMAAVFCILVEPIFVWGGVYVMLQWKSIFGLPIYAFIAFASKGIVQLIFNYSKPPLPLPVQENK
jgi:hypothetical protein